MNYKYTVGESDNDVDDYNNNNNIIIIFVIIIIKLHKNLRHPIQLKVKRTGGQQKILRAFMSPLLYFDVHSLQNFSITLTFVEAVFLKVP